MSNSYQWIISQLDCYPQHANQNDVVFNIHWRRQVNDGNGHIAEIYGSQSVTLDPQASFTPYENLTQTQVEGWLESAFGSEALAAQLTALDQQIENQINPPVIAPKLPWAA